MDGRNATGTGRKKSSEYGIWKLNMDSNVKHKIAIGSDHGGYPMKSELIEYITAKGYPVQDCGTFSTDAADYPEFAHKVAAKISSGEAERGIVIDGAGIGSCMAANKFPGVRAAMCYDLSTASNAREHNDANVLSLGAGLIGSSLAKKIVDIF
ncbi:MAG: RpiB/LacA/LacB family sugar-phosphate isomerase, partial [FCB group bacterium]|nr:RpiB/LacA/LacB family sugar-phosphate isomerase [FCB group bacterium]